MIRTIIMVAVLVFICAPLLTAGFFLRGLGTVFIRPACRLGNRIGRWHDEGRAF